MMDEKAQQRIEEIAEAVFSKTITVQKLREQMNDLTPLQRSLLLERLARGQRTYATTRY